MTIGLSSAAQKAAITRREEGVNARDLGMQLLRRMGTRMPSGAAKTFLATLDLSNLNGSTAADLASSGVKTFAQFRQCVVKSEQERHFWADVHVRWTNAVLDLLWDRMTARMHMSQRSLERRKDIIGRAKAALISGDCASLVEEIQAELDELSYRAPLMRAAMTAILLLAQGEDYAADALGYAEDVCETPKRCVPYQNRFCVLYVQAMSDALAQLKQQGART